LYSHVIAECLDCGHQGSYSPNDSICPSCGGGWREARYDYETIGKTFLKELSTRPFNIWRYHDALPIQDPQPVISMGEGGTPLLKAANLGTMLGRCAKIRSHF